MTDTVSGMGHFVHSIRRNLDMTYIAHNNQIYGLTTGQASPTSDHLMPSVSTPKGVLEEPVNPIGLALAEGATFVARGFAGDVDHLTDLYRQAIQHDGFAIVDVFQPCVTWNKINTFKWFRERVYKLDETDYDPSDRAAAFDLSLTHVPRPHLHAGVMPCPDRRLLRGDGRAHLRERCSRLRRALVEARTRATRRERSHDDVRVVLPRLARRRPRHLPGPFVSRDMSAGLDDAERPAGLPEGVERLVEVLARVSCHDRGAQPVHASRYGRMHDGAHEDAAIEEHASEVHRLVLVADERRDDAAVREHRVPALRLESIGPVRCVLVQLCDTLRLVLDDVERSRALQRSEQAAVRPRR